MNYVVTVWMIVCIENDIIAARGNGMMVQDQVQVTMPRSQQNVMRPVSHRHQRERPRDLARTPHSEQKEPHDCGQPLPLTMRESGTKRPTRVA
jgi:hypothetical protein